VDVGDDAVAGGGLEDLEPADVDLLADLAGHVGDGLAERAAALEGERVQRVEVGGALAEDEVGDLVGESGEVLVARDEVGLGVDLDDHAEGLVVSRGGGDDALGGLAVGALVGDLLTLLAEDLDGGVEVAVGFGEGLLAVHHPDAGAVAEALDVLGGNRAHRGDRNSMNGENGERAASRPSASARPAQPSVSASAASGSGASAPERSASAAASSAWSWARFSCSACWDSRSTSAAREPSMMASAMACVTTWMDFIASSLAGMP